METVNKLPPAPYEQVPPSHCGPGIARLNSSQADQQALALASKNQMTFAKKVTENSRHNFQA